MEAYVFTDAPTAANLRKILGSAYRFFLVIDRAAKGFLKEWKDYGRNYGWTYKVWDKRKALLWITPRPGSFIVGMTLREEERDALLGKRISPCMMEQIRGAREYSEGYAIRVEIRTKTDCEHLLPVIRGVISIRKKARTCATAPAPAA